MKITRRKNRADVIFNRIYFFSHFFESLVASNQYIIKKFLNGPFFPLMYTDFIQNVFSKKLKKKKNFKRIFLLFEKKKFKFKKKLAFEILLYRLNLKLSSQKNLIIINYKIKKRKNVKFTFKMLSFLFQKRIDCRIFSNQKYFFLKTKYSL